MTDAGDSGRRGPEEPDPATMPLRPIPRRDATADDAGPNKPGPSDAGPGNAEHGSAGPGNAGPGNTGPNRIGPADAGPHNAGRDNAAPNTAAPDKAAPGNADSDKAATEQAVPGTTARPPAAAPVPAPNGPLVRKPAPQSPPTGRPQAAAGTGTPAPAVSTPNQNPWPTVPATGKPAPAVPSGRKRALLAAGRTLVALLAVAVLVGTGAAWRGYHEVIAGVTTSQALDDTPKSANADQNILVMGLDSRLDEKGNPLPQDMYDALHAGDDSVGGYNSNVLILLHIPGDGSKSTAISIPRDDYVALDSSACDVAPCKGKIKQAYGYAYERAKEKLQNAKTVTDPVTIEQKSRDAGRKAEIATVKTFLGNNIPIDHFVEVTLVAFFQIAQAVQPITVCLNERTQDDFSGADFKKGRQEIDAAQAMAFVRQRRDPDPSLNFTDLDRTRRQQAFIVSLARKLSNTGAMASPTILRSLLDVAKQNIAIDNNLDLVAFAQRAAELMSGGITLFTLPVKDFGTDDLGEDINLVDLSQVHAIVKSLLSDGSPLTTTAAAPTTESAASGVVVNVINGSGQTGLAARLQQALRAKGFTEGTVGTGTIRSASTLSYGAGADAAAASLADSLGLTPTSSASLDPNTIQLIVGTDSSNSGPIADLANSIPAASTSPTTTGGWATTSAEPPPPVSATATGVNAPEPTDLSSMDGGDIPCVK